jgi:hypothetical protein
MGTSCLVDSNSGVLLAVWGISTTRCWKEWATVGVVLTGVLVFTGAGEELYTVLPGVKPGMEAAETRVALQRIHRQASMIRDIIPPKSVHENTAICLFYRHIAIQLNACMLPARKIIV